MTLKSSHPLHIIGTCKNTSAISAVTVRDLLVPKKRPGVLLGLAYNVKKLRRFDNNVEQFCLIGFSGNLPPPYL